MKRARKSFGLKKTVVIAAAGAVIAYKVIAANADEIKQVLNFKDPKKPKIENVDPNYQNPHKDLVVPIEKADKKSDLTNNLEGGPDTGYVAVLEDIYNNFSNDLDNLSTNVKGLVNQAHNRAKLMRDDPNSAKGNMEGYLKSFLRTFSQLYDPHYVYSAKDRGALYRMADELAPYVKEFGLENTHAGLLVTNEVYRNNFQHILDLDNQGALRVLNKKLDDGPLQGNDLQVYLLLAYKSYKLEPQRWTTKAKRDFLVTYYRKASWNNEQAGKINQEVANLMRKAKTLMLNPSTKSLPKPVIEEKDVSLNDLM